MSTVEVSLLRSYSLGVIECCECCC